MTVVTMFSAAGTVSKTPSPSTRIVTGSGGKLKGFGLYFLAEISTRRYAPLTFPPLPVTIRVDGVGVLDTVPAAENIVTTVTHRHVLSDSYRKTIFRPSCILLFQ